MHLHLHAHDIELLAHRVTAQSMAHKTHKNNGETKTNKAEQNNIELEQCSMVAFHDVDFILIV
jgi:hypothetical protein